MADYLRAGTNGLDALHGIPVRDFRLFLAIKTRVKLGADLRRQVEEQLAKMGIRRLAPEELVSFYRRIFNGVFAPAPGVFLGDSVGGMPAPPIARQIIEAGPDLCFEGPEVFLGNQVARCLTPKAPARRITAERANRLMGGMRGSAEDSDQIGGLPLLPQRPVRSFPVRDSQARANPLRAKGRRQLCGRSRQADRGNRLDPRRGLKQPLRFGDPDHVGVWTRQRQAREMAARAKRLWESEPLPFMVQERAICSPSCWLPACPSGFIPKSARSNCSNAIFACRSKPRR
jgi:conjugal transfer ATP-binding protein TraC